MRIPSGVTDQYIYFVAVDSTDYVSRETGLASFTVYRSRNGGASSVMTTPTINETDTTNMPGVYELLLDEDMTIDSGDDSQEMVFHITHAGMAPVTRTIELYRPKLTAGETLTVSSSALPWNSAWDAEVESECNDALVAIHLDHLLSADYDPASKPGTATALLNELVEDDGGVSRFTTNALENGPSGGSPPTAAAIADAVWDEAIAGHVGAGSFGEEVQAHATAAEVNAQVLDVLNTDTFSMIGQESPGATVTLAYMIRWMYKVSRNQKQGDSSAGFNYLYADDESTIDQKQTIAETSTTYTRGEWKTGP